MSEINVAEAAGAAIAICAVVSAVWPEPKNPVLRTVWQIVNMIGANVGKAKNKGDK